MATEEKKATAKAGGYMSEEDKQKAGVSAADLELPGAQLGGETIVKKPNPEIPTQAQIEANTVEQPGPTVTKITVTDSEGKETEHVLAPDDAARVSSIVEAAAAHPSFAAGGHQGNPNIRETTDADREADQKAYEKRFS